MRHAPAADRVRERPGALRPAGAGLRGGHPCIPPSAEINRLQYDLDEPAPATVASIDLNPGQTEGPDGAELTPAQNTVDGRYGAGTAPFTNAPDQFGRTMPFALSWTSTEDLSGAVVSRALGLAAAPVVAGMSARFDNVDVYRIAYLTLFGRRWPTRRVAWSRLDPTAPAPRAPHQAS